MHEANDMAQKNLDLSIYLGAMYCILGLLSVSAWTGIMKSLLEPDLSAAPCMDFTIVKRLKCWYTPVQEQHKNAVDSLLCDQNGFACKTMRWALHEEEWSA